VGIRLVDLIRRPVPPKLQLFRKSEAGPDQTSAGYSRTLQAARVRAAHQRSYFAPALFNLVPVETTLIGSMAVDSYWRLYYNDGWVASHTVEENATLLIHEVGHLLRNHEARKKDAGIRDHGRWNTAGDCEINDDLHAEGLPLPGDPPLPGKYGLQTGNTAEVYYKQLPTPPRGDTHEATGGGEQSCPDCGSGAHGERRFWELPADDGAEGGVPGVDAVKAELVRREVAQRIDAARLLCQEHVDVDVLVADDGLQHLALARDAQLIVFDERGAGNGLLLPAGPLREALPRELPERTLVIYNASQPSTALPGFVVSRSLAGVIDLARWWQGQRAEPQGWQALRDRRIVACAGTAVPQRFFSMLQAQGLDFEPLAMPDHADYSRLPWPEGTLDVVLTEKDAVKIRPQRVGSTQVWVAPLDFGLDDAVGQALKRWLPPPT
jgi:tetraacyldisaccharide 4'-kinase